MYWEIIELEDGDVALVREDDDEPMLTIGFSSEARARLASNHIEVAKAMIGAGMDAVEYLQEEQAMTDDEDFMTDDRDPATSIH